MPHLRKLGIVMIASGALAACDTTNFAERALVDPNQYAIFACKDLYLVIEREKQRQNSLRNLMAKASEGAGGGVVNAMVYRPEYLQSRGNQHVAEEMLKEKRCEPHR